MFIPEWLSGLLQVAAELCQRGQEEGHRQRDRGGVARVMGAQTTPSAVVSTAIADRL